MTDWQAFVIAIHFFLAGSLFVMVVLDFSGKNLTWLTSVNLLLCVANISWGMAYLSKVII